MAEFRLTDRARADLIDIHDFPESRFGTYQADAYYAGLIRSCGLLADFPRIGQPADELAQGYRRFRFQSHFIFSRSTLKSAPSSTAPKTSGRSCSNNR
jgi:toxin ParE1/3/4